MVQRPARHRAAARRLLPPFERQGRTSSEGDTPIHPWRSFPRPPGPSQADEPLAHGDGRGRDEGEGQGRPALDARPRQDVQGHGRRDRAPGRVPRRRPSPGPRPAPPAGNAGDVRRVPAALGRHAPVPPRRGGQHPPRPLRRRQAARPLGVPVPEARLLDDETGPRPAVRRGTRSLRAGLSRRQRRGHAGAPEA